MSAWPMVHRAAPPGTGLHVVGAWLWRLLVFLVVLLAVYVSAGRYAMSNVSALREQLLGELNQRLPFTVAATRLSGAWSAFSPEFAFDGLLITQPDGDGDPVRLRSGRLRIDIPASIVSRSLQLSHLDLEGLMLQGRLTADGRFELEGFETGGGGALQRWLREFLPRVERVALLDSTLRLSGLGDDKVLNADLSLTRAGNERLLQARLAGTGLRLFVHADGVGNPLTPLLWSGDVFVDVASGSLEDFGSLWSGLDWPFSLAGSTEAQFWLTRSGGDSQARVRVKGAQVVVAERSGAWSLPLDAVSFDAALNQRRNHWELLAADFHAEREGRVLDLARVQFEWWGSALRLRAREMSLDALPSLLAAAPGIPGGLREALPVLAPSGRVESVELRLDDLAVPAASWSVRGLLDGVSVESWRGAPGVDGVSGYFELRPGAGTVQLDAAPFAMDFPKVYAEPMRYDSAWGDIGLRWDREGLDIDSGLVRARGEEGEVHALFAVHVPFVPTVTGPEMELLAGLAGARAQDRRKYVPMNLPQPLLDWLDSSIGEATVTRAGFIWRGSLRPRNSEHRTVQLALDVEDAQLRFDPAWPALTDFAATVYVDDRLTWARAERGRLYATTAEDLRVRVRPREGGAQLSVRTRVRGDASDGQRLLVTSPLAGLTGNVFEDWTMRGSVSGTLALDLELGRGDPTPAVDLQLALDDVAAQMTALALPVESVSGDLRYRSGRGFAGSALRGALWGQPVQASAPPVADGISVDISGALDIGQLAPWLGQPVLGFAGGVSDVAGTLRLERGSPLRLQLSSGLEGATLDAPPPYQKSAGQPLPLALELALDSEPTLGLALGERLQIDMRFAGAALAQLQARLGSSPGSMDCDALLCAHGEISELDLSAWRSFADRYVFGPAEGERPVAPAPAATVDYRIDSLNVGHLSAGPRQLGPARVDLHGRGARWQGAVESPWLQGSLSHGSDGEDLHLLVEYLDLAELDGDDASDTVLTPAAVRAVLPSMRVDVLELRDGGELLGGFGFDLDTQQDDGGVFASGLSGELWGVDLAPREPGFLAWVPRDSGSGTAVELDLAFGDLGATLERLGYARSLETDSGSAAVRLSWPDAPTAYRVEESAGTVVVALADGRVIETKPGALAVVSFFNLAEILRRLSLAHMFESGIPFETASVELAFADGVMDIRDLQIDGAASAFSFGGRRDLSSGDIDGELVVTLPVASNLPWVAALAGGPAMAAGVFVVSKVFEKQVNRMSSAVYEVQGAIDDPQVSFRRLFDDRPGSPAGEAEPDDDAESPAVADDDPGAVDDTGSVAEELSGNSDETSGPPALADDASDQDAGGAASEAGAVAEATGATLIPPPEAP